MASSAGAGVKDTIEQLGRGSLALIEEFGYYLVLVVESAYWIFIGPFKKQPVKLGAVFAQMVEIGLSALPIVFMLSFAIGVMLAIQGIHTLKQFGAEEQVVLDRQRRQIHTRIDRQEGVALLHDLFVEIGACGNDFSLQVLGHHTEAVPGRHKLEGQ